MKYIEGGVTAPKGFKAWGCRSGVKRKGLDLAVLDCPGGASSAGLFTSNSVKAAPVVVSMEHLKSSDGYARAVVANSGNANACNGERGMRDARAVARRSAELLDTSPESVLLASTGVIGRPMQTDRILAGLETLVPRLSAGREADLMASRAIMTTDTVPKEAALSYEFDGDMITLGGMAKGAGMIHPHLATMLGFLTTDADIDPGPLRKALSCAADRSFNMISVDGDMSTNDTLFILSSGGGSKKSIEPGTEGYMLFLRALTEVCVRLAKGMVRDAEGASTLFEVHVTGAMSQDDARRSARAVARSNLVKTAIFGRDPNWGRILAAIGYSGAEIDQDRVDISLEAGEGPPLEWVSRGQQVSEKRNERARELLGEPEFKVNVDLGLGECEASSWGCDLSYEYVKINSEYTT